MPNKTPLPATESDAVPDAGMPQRVVAAPAAVPPELSSRPKRRTFTAAERLRILAETDRAADTGGIAAILRREGLYSSTLTDWRRQRDAGAFEALKPVKRGPKTAPANPLEAELTKARQDIARFQRRLERAEAVIDVQIKFSDLLGIALPPADSDETPR